MKTAIGAQSHIYFFLSKNTLRGGENTPKVLCTVCTRSDIVCGLLGVCENFRAPDGIRDNRKKPFIDFTL